MQTIVVGVDGSEHGEAALAFAAEEAALRGRTCSSSVPGRPLWWWTPMGAYPAESFEGLAENARSIAEAAVARAAELHRWALAKARRSKVSQPLFYSKKPNRRT